MIVVYLGTHAYARTQDVDLFEAYARVATLIHVDPDPSMRARAKTAQAAAKLTEAVHYSEAGRVIAVPMPTALPGSRFDLVARLNRWNGLRTILTGLRRDFADERITLVCQRPDLLPTLRGLPADLRVYEVRDDYAALEDDRYKARRVRADHARMVKSADLVWTTSKRLANDIRAGKAEVVESSNGVDYTTFARAAEGDPPAAMAAINPPRIGLVGMLNDRIDWALLERLAEARPAWQLTLVGPVYLAGATTEQAVTRLQQLPNVHLLPGVTHAEVPAYIAGLDVGLIPYVLDEATLRINPYKVYQYLAAGIAVVASRLPALLELTDAVRCCATTDQFISAIEDAVARVDDAQAARNRQTRAEQFDWSHIARKRLDAANAAIDARGRAAARATVAA